MSNKQLIILNVAILGGAILIYFIATGWTKWGIMEKFASVVILGGVMAVLVTSYILPAVGESIGAFFYTPPERIEQDDRQKAMAKVAQGDYEGAIALFKKAAKNEPEDRFPVVEIAKIQVEQFNDAESAIKTLKVALAREGWRDNDSAFFHFRMAEILIENRDDPESAKQIYQEIIEKYPETRHSANAIHKLHELEAV